MMKRKIIKLVILFFVGVCAYGQAPDWTVNENDFEYTMSFVAFVNIDGINLSSTNDMVGAFSNGEIRGVTKLVYAPTKDRYYAYLTIFSNANDEAISFKVYDATNNQIRDIGKSLNFEINAHYGDLFQAYSIADPALNDESEILSFSFKDVNILNQTINGNDIRLYVNNGENLTALNAIFELSDGSQLFSDSVLLEPENNTLDFSNPVTIQVLSEDESKLEEWIITVVYNNDIGNLTFYKKDAVCYNGGAIKVLSSENGNIVTLFKDQTQYATQSLNNGEVIFNNLESDTYKVKVGENVKEIIINQK